MIIYIDFASFGDSNFYRKQWDKSLMNSKLSFFSIVTDFHFSISNNHITLPHFFFSNKFFDNIFKFIFQTSVIIFLGIWILIMRKNVKIIFNLHQPFVYWQFLNFFKNNNVKTIGIIHDIIEFDTSRYPKIIISTNKRIIQNLDSVILHAGKSMFTKVYSYKNNIYMLPFPERKPYEYMPPFFKFEYILLPGRYREEKGFDFVIVNWPRIEKTIPLVVMAKVPNHLEVIIRENANIIYNPNLTSTELFENLIFHCKASVLMYTKGTNSGILQTLISNQKHIITSKIAIFQEHHACKYFTFCDNNPFIFQKLINSFNLINTTSQVYTSQNSETDSEYIKFLIKLF